jgi:hypothetical protein
MKKCQLKGASGMIEGCKGASGRWLYEEFLSVIQEYEQQTEGEREGKQDLFHQLEKELSGSHPLSLRQEEVELMSQRLVSFFQGCLLLPKRD